MSIRSVLHLAFIAAAHACDLDDATMIASFGGVTCSVSQTLHELIALSLHR